MVGAKGATPAVACGAHALLANQVHSAPPPSLPQLSVRAKAKNAVFQWNLSATFRGEQAPAARINSGAFPLPRDIKVLLLMNSREIDSTGSPLTPLKPSRDGNFADVTPWREQDTIFAITKPTVELDGHIPMHTSSSIFNLLLPFIASSPVKALNWGTGREA